MSQPHLAARRDAAFIQWILNRRLDIIVPRVLATFAVSNAAAMTIYHLCLWYSQ